MLSGKDHPNSLKSLAEILEEELNGEIGSGTSSAEISETQQQERLKDVYRRIHSLETKRSALCLSGGGIRSASFGLGILQALARAGLLDKFDYLSTVSGGGYIGGWLSAWIHHHPRGCEGVVAELKTTQDQLIEPESDPIRHLRAFSNYLTPRFGLFSADSWSIGATILRDILLNWIVLLSWLAAILLIPRFCVFGAFVRPAPTTLVALLVAAFVSLATATAYAALDLPSFGDSRWPQRRFLLGWFAPMVAAAFFFFAWWVGFRNTSELAGPFISSQWGLLSIQIVVGLASAAGCLAAACVVAYRDRGTSPSPPKFARLLNIAGALLVTILLTGALTGFFAWWIAAKIFPDPVNDVRNFICFALPLLLGLFCSANALFNGLTSWFTSDEDREWWGRAIAWLLIGAVVWSSVNALVLWAPTVVAQIEIAVVWKWLLAACGGALGLITALLGFSKATGVLSQYDPLSSRDRLLAAASLAFFVLLSCMLSWILDPPGSAMGDPRYLWDAGTHGEFFKLLWVLAGLAGLGVIMGYLVNVNKFSLHALFRNRLIRAFLGASRSVRKPHWFTGFDPDDNIRVCDLKPGRPFHVINLALNLVRGGQLAWQERMAAPFSVSRLHCGSWVLAYRPSTQFGGGITLGTALAISGALANPNQGYNSSTLVAFIMTLFNLRLGWWLGNPSRHGARTWDRSGPIHAALPLFNEALGTTNESYAYVNLSDGGHFDNLGLYEMVLRRCRHIVVVDAGCDDAYVFEDLGNALRKIRIDLGISIDIRAVSPKKEGAQASYYALGTIRYSQRDGPGTDGALLYIKPTVCGMEPADVIHYAASHPDFPHEPTTDQWFSESQMESYRALGFHAATIICQGATESQTIAEFFSGLTLRDLSSQGTPPRESKAAGDSQPASESSQCQT
ncbi:MAG: patatin-like phospholipase family protein [Terrimicrobiaceae bacterium]